MRDSTSLFDFVLPNAWGGGKGSCEGAVKRTWRSKNKAMEKCTADRQLQRHEDNNGWTHPRWSQLFFLKLSLRSKETSDLQDPEMHSMLGWAMVRVAKRDGEWRRSPFNILGQDMKIWVCYLLKAICCLTHSKRRLSLCRRCRTHYYLRKQGLYEDTGCWFLSTLKLLNQLASFNHMQKRGRCLQDNVPTDLFLTEETKKKFITYIKRREIQPSTSEEGNRRGMSLSLPVGPWLTCRSPCPYLPPTWDT